MNQDTRKLLEQMCAHGFAANLNVLVKYNENTPQDAWIPASAIRILARRGDVPDEAIDALIAVFDATQEMAAQVHLMKALAAFGRKASDAEISILSFIAELHITNDEVFWAFDSALHVLSYVGEELTRSFLEILDEEAPSRVLRSDSVYVGELSANERADWYTKSLATVFEKIESTDPGTWTKKMTSHQIPEGEAVSKISPWMTR